MFDEGQTNTPVEPTDTPVTPAQEDWLVIGDRKYDKEAVVTKITHADSHISNLEKELAETRAKLELTTAQQEAQRAMFQSNNQTQSTPTPIVHPTDDSDKGGQAELLSQVEQILLAKEQERKQGDNLRSSVEAAKAMFGDAYQQKLEELGSSLGLSKADITELASTKPNVFRASFGLNAQAPQPKPSYTSTVTIASQQQGDDPYRSLAKVVLGSKSAQERTRAIADMLANSKR